jgi:hypothetical protein
VAGLITGTDAFFRTLRRLAKDDRGVIVAVGYSKAPRSGDGDGRQYALPVHENPHAYHAPPTSYKYLERPLRESARYLVELIARIKREGRSLGDAMTRAGHSLLRLSRPVTPIETGALRRSGFVVREN